MKEAILEPPEKGAVKLASSRKRGNSSNLLIDVLIAISVVGDMVVFVLALMAAFYVRFNVEPFRSMGIAPIDLEMVDYVGHFVLGTALFSLVAVRCGLYARQNIFRLRKVGIALTDAVAYWTIVYLFFSLLFYFQPPISRIFVLVGAVLGTLFLFAWRYLYHALLQREEVSARIRQRILVVGWNLEAQKLAESVYADASHPYEIFGCVPSAHGVYMVQPPSHVKQLGSYAEVQQILIASQVDIVLIADVDPKTEDILSLCEFCNREMVQFKVIPSYFQILISGLHLETISSVPVLGVARLPLDSLINRVIKRLIDIAGAIVGLLLTAPILVVFGTIVYLESPGPIIYRQVREGRQGHTFMLYKIRSMKLDAEKDGPQWSKQNDPRRLRIGGFLRNWNLDEFPQFWNVLKGEMSLTGPRPERPELIKNFKDQIRNYNARHYIKPGLTGWAQVHGLRGDTDLNERLRYDLYYLENWSPMLDFYIMFRTLYKDRPVKRAKTA